MLPQQPPPVKQPSQPQQPKKSNMDLLGDLGGDFFASAAPAASSSNTGEKARSSCFLVQKYYKSFEKEIVL